MSDDEPYPMFSEYSRWSSQSFGLVLSAGALAAVAVVGLLLRFLATHSP